MKALVLIWLNGKREYHTGVIILKKYYPDHPLLGILTAKSNNKNVSRLLVAMEDIADNKVPAVADVPGSKTDKIITVPPSDYSHTDLYKSCKNEADLLFKKLMNDRAILFNQIRSLLPHDDPNRPDLVDSRKKSTIDIAYNYIKVSKMYDRSDIVKKTGRLSYDEKEASIIDTSHIPDSLVKQSLDNLRKNINKIKKREQTPERISLLNEHYLTLKSLEERWRLLTV